MFRISAALAVLGLATALSGCRTRAPEILTWSEYARNTPYDFPLQLELRGRDGRLLYYGARHSYDPSDSQHAQIEELWRSFRPTLALNEGGHPPVQPTREDAIRRSGEAGLVRFLAARDNVPVTTLDPSRSQEVAWLTLRFPPERVKLFFVLLAAAQFVEREGTDGLPAEVERVLRIFHATPGLGQPPATWPEVEAAFERHFPDHGPVRGVPLSWFDPTREDTFLNAIARASSEYRDLFIVDLLARHVAEGHRVFAVVGGSHVVCQEARLRWALERISRGSGRSAFGRGSGP